MTLATSIAGVRAKLSAKASKFMPDLCDLTSRTYAAGATGGRTETSTPAGTNIPCSYRLRKTPIEQQKAGASTSLLDYDLIMPSYATTEAIRPHYKIVVQPRDNTGALTFENPVILSESLAPFVVVAAALKV